ncbi:MAG: 50S ribosomal protein L25 [Flavobacteriales bacterium]|nr:50S ribosomal protein L25 [Flavobacteriales bacterium]
MKSVEIKASLREDAGSKSQLNALRKEGQIPAVIYGGKENVNFSVDEGEFTKIINTPDIHLVDLNFGKSSTKAVIREVQFHPVTDDPIHIDFMEVFDDKPIIIGVPVKFVGKSIGVLNGGKRREKLRKLVIKALPKDVPSEIEVDISNLRIGHGIKVEEIELENAEFMDHPKAVVVAVKTARAAIEEIIDEDEEGEEGEEGAEGEGGEATAEGATEEKTEAAAE